MKKFVYLHFGFVKPTPEIMQAWGAWFKSIADKIVDQGGHFSKGREISKSGTRDLPMKPSPSWYKGKGFQFNQRRIYLERTRTSQN